MQTIEDILLKEILDNPEDDTPRLVYADYLADQGQMERAEFIQVQCKLAKLGECQRDFSLGLSCCCSFCRTGGLPLSWREQELLRTNLPNTDGQGVTPAIYIWWAPISRFYTAKWNVIYRRGLVDEIKFHTNDLLDHAKEIFSAQPITKINLYDCQPAENRGLWYWEVYGSDIAGSFLIPEELFRLLPTVKEGDWQWASTSKQLALDCLSEACVLYGQKMAQDDGVGYMGGETEGKPI